MGVCFFWGGRHTRRFSGATHGSVLRTPGRLAGPYATLRIEPGCLCAKFMLYPLCYRFIQYKDFFYNKNHIVNNYMSLISMDFIGHQKHIIISFNNILYLVVPFKVNFIVLAPKHSHGSLHEGSLLL